MSINTSTTPWASLPWAVDLSSLPLLPGVYWFLDENNKVLYVGKAKNLKKRLKSYTLIKQLSNKNKELVRSAKQLKFKILASELQAILIEAELIRTHQPQFNILLKDDKSPIYLYISKTKYPQLQICRRKEINKLPHATVLGPFQSTYKLREVLKISRQIFKWCDHPQSNRACFYYQLQLCSGACIGKISPSNYGHDIKALILFLKGKQKQVNKKLKEEMQLKSKNKNYEEAAKLRDQLELITEVTSPEFKLSPDITLPKLSATIKQEALLQLRRVLRQYLSLPKDYQLKRIEGYDVSNTQGQQAAVSLVTFTNGTADSDNYRLFNIRTLNTPNDYQMMKEALIRRQRHPEWGRPELVVIDGGKGQLRAALSVWHWDNPVISIVKNPDRLIIPIILDQEKKLKIKYQIIRLTPDHPALKLIQQIRDESHRFSKKQHAKLRLRSLIPSP